MANHLLAFEINKLKLRNMKKAIFIAMMILLGFQAQAQKFYSTTGRWDSVSVQNYLLTIDDLAVVVDTMIQGGSYVELSSGCKVKILHRQDWLDKIIECYQAIDNTINSGNIIDAIKKSEYLKWTGNGSSVDNYYWLNGKVDCIKNFSSVDLSTIAYNGYPVIKRSCGNPLMNTSIVQISTNTSSITYTTPTGATFTPAGQTNTNGQQVNTSGQINVHYYGDVYVTPTGATFTPNPPQPQYHPNCGCWF